MREMGLCSIPISRECANANGVWTSARTAYLLRKVRKRETGLHGSM